MPSQILHNGQVVVLDYRCEAGPGDRPFAEEHARFSLSYVRRGSFGCRMGGRAFELVAGGFLVGFPGDEYVCTHDHHDGGDECLSIQLTPEAADELSAAKAAWRLGALAPIAELSVLGEQVQHAAAGRSGVAPDEAALALVDRFVRLVQDRGAETVGGPVPARVRRAMVHVADWMDEACAEQIDLSTAARWAGMSSWHFLRSFRQVIGITPHQHLVRARLRRAARRLLEDDAPVTEVALDAGFSDLSNFVRTFGRAAGVSPRRFRASAAADRNFLQEASRRLSSFPR